jgi:3',5'-cyclic AMP phosphodiesterase CpdA
MVVITGDIVNSGSEEEMDVAGKHLSDLSNTNPVIIVPGNHDYAWMGNVFVEDSRKYWDDLINGIQGDRSITHDIVDYAPGIKIYKTNTTVYISLDSGDPSDHELCARGYLSSKQIVMLSRVLGENKGKVRIVMLHHHPFDFNLFTALENADLLMDALRGNCEILLFGHDHNYGIWWGEYDIPLIVASHKSTEPISGDCLAITVINKTESGYDHRLEIVGG